MLEPVELVFAVTLAILFICVGYYFYFIPQRYPPKQFYFSKQSEIDEIFKFEPRWVWIYSLAYYPFIISPILTIENLAEFLLICLNYFMLLGAHVCIALRWPVKTPDEWRGQQIENSLSLSFLRLVQKIDKGGNCFPSMHVAVAVLTGLHLVNNTGWNTMFVNVTVFVIVIAITLSTLFTKQHFFRDIIPSFPLAVAIFTVYFFLWG